MTGAPIEPAAGLSPADRARAARELARFDAGLPVAAAWTPPASWYVDPALGALERQAVLPRAWQPVARAADLARPGATACGRLLGRPWVVTRAEDGALRAFHNVCRHKGHEVAREAGAARELVCGYHGWTYGLDGGLRRAPRSAGMLDFDRAALSLPPLAVDVFGPWVVVCDDPRAVPLSERAPEVHARLCASGWERTRFFARREWTLACDWKVYVDNYLDGGYHVPHMHPSLAAQLDMASYRTELFARSSIQGAAPSREAAPGLDVDARARIGAGTIYAWLHPNWMLNRYGPWLESNHVLPLDDGRALVVDEFFVDADCELDADELERSLAQSAVTQREDIAICESVQVGLCSGAYDRGRYAPEVELADHAFHRLLAADLRAALDALA